MRTLKYIVSAVVFMGSSVLSLHAQDSVLNRNITVEREYKPVIHDAGKIKSTPKTLEPKVEKVKPTFSDFNLPLNADYSIHTLPAAQLDREKHAEDNGGFARFGLGNYFNTLAEFAYPLINSEETKLDFSFNHLSTLGTKAHSNTHAAVSFDQYFNSVNLYAGMGLGHEYLKYYGNNFDSINSAVNFSTLAKTNGSAAYSELNAGKPNGTVAGTTLNELAADYNSNTFWRFNAFAGVRSLPAATELRYKAEMQFKSFSAINGLSEKQVHTQVGFDKQNDDNRFGVNLDMHNLSYASNNSSIINTINGYSVLALNPFYSIEQTDLDIHLGVKSSFSFAPGHPFRPSPDLYAEWRAVPNQFALYGGIGGDFSINTMDKIFAENRYTFNNMRVDDTYTPYELYLGFKFKPVYNLLIDGFVDYKQFDNQYFFVNKEYSCDTLTGNNSNLFSNRFNVIYSKASQAKIGIRANYNLCSTINVQFKGAYNGWTVKSEEHAWNKPDWEADLSSDIKISNELTVSGNLFYEGKRWAKIGTTAVPMNSKIDINLGAAYSYSNSFTAFGKINNLINRKYQDFYGYDVQGFNVMAGVAFSF